MKSYLKWILSVILLPFNFSYAHEKTRDEILVEEERINIERSKRFVTEFYTLDVDEDCKDITEAVLLNPETKENIRAQILATGRQFFLFNYPSDGLKIKGTISFVSNSDENPLLIYLRGGNRLLGLQHPATDITCAKNYTVLSTCYRGGVSEGVDEYGGDDVNDVVNLIKFFPILQEKIGLKISTKEFYILGASRGGMEMFLALSRFSSLQQIVKKAVSLSGLLDLEETLLNRPDLIDMFTNDFGLIPGKNDVEWKKKRHGSKTAKFG